MASHKSLSNIPQFFSGKNILITGASGFVGKALIEKLLRCCPDVGNIYLLIREKKGKGAQDRLKEIIENPLFDTLRKENSQGFTKLIAVQGDVTELNLGLREDHRTTLIENVNIAYHTAASIRFDDSLVQAVIMNTRGTREMASLVLEMKRLDLFVHMSTAYSNCDKFLIEEKMYPPPADWRKIINIAEHLDGYTLNCFTDKCLGGYPNTYTFTKHLAEHVVYDMCSGRIPTVIFRPSVVIPSNSEPIPGWTDNFNGPVGIVVAGGTGLLRSVYMDPDIAPDYIPVDILVRGLIALTWYEANLTQCSQKLTVYNGCGGTQYPLTPATFFKMGKEIIWKTGMELQMFHPNLTPTSNYVEYYLSTIFLQLLPAILGDLLLKLAGKKPKLVKIQRKFHVAITVLSHFTNNKFTFVHDKFLSVNEKLLPQDFDDFYFCVDDWDMFTYIKNNILTIRQVLLHEDPKKINLYERKAVRNKMIYYAIIYVFWGTVIYNVVLKAMRLMNYT